MSLYFNVRKNCPACSSKKKHTLISLAYDKGEVYDFITSVYNHAVTKEILKGHRFTVVECLDCKLLYHEEVPSTSLLEKIYPSEVTQPEVFPDYTANKKKEYLKEIQEIENLFDNKELTILDFGMGYGRWGLDALNQGHHVYGSEYSKDLCDYAKKKGILILNENTLKENFFDFINTEQVFEHLVVRSRRCMYQVLLSNLHSKQFQVWL